MSTTEQIALIRTLFEEAERRNILLWLESGWAIDARLGKITREHEDIDIAFSKNQEAEYRQLIESLGFGEHEILDYGFLSRRGGVLLDSEPCFEFNGEYNFENFPAASCPIQKQGVLDGYQLRCVSWEALYFEFLGYEDEIPQKQWRDKDFQSLRAIETNLTAAQKQMLRNLYLNQRPAN